jgi:hypothetical protein
MHHLPIKQRIPRPKRPPLHISTKLLSSSCSRRSLCCRLLPPLQQLLLPLPLLLS